MNLSLRNRVATSFFLAGVVVIVLSFVIFHHLNSLNKEIESVSNKSNQVTMLTDEIRISVVRILKRQREIIANKPTPELIQSILNSCEAFTSQLQRLDSLYSEPEVKKNIGQMLSYVDSLKVVLGKASLFHRDNIGMTSVGELADKILESFTDSNISNTRKTKSVIER